MAKNGEYRPRLSPDEMKVVSDYRLHKTEHEALKKECEEKGIPIEDVNYYWLKSERFSINVSNKENRFNDVMSSMIEDIKKYAPKYPKITYSTKKEGHLLVIDPADIHFNKLASANETGDRYDHNIATKRVLEGVMGVINKSKGFDIDQVLFVIGNDILHVDSPRNTTTSGTQQDVSMMWYDAFKLAQQILVKVTEVLVQIAPVHIQYDPSNHDYTNGFFLAQCLESWFKNHKNITFNVSIAHRKYYKYFSNLIATTHGDGAKEQDLPLLMAHESPEWSSCKHKYVYTHHIHHKKSKDYMGVTVESVRSPSGSDSWHHRQGYQHAPKAIEGFIHHKQYGQVARISHIFS